MLGKYVFFSCKSHSNYVDRSPVWAALRSYSKQKVKTKGCLPEESYKNMPKELKLETLKERQNKDIGGLTKNTQKPDFFWKTEKITKNARTQKRLETWQNQRYALWPEVSNPLGSVVSTMLCWTKNTPKPDFFLKREKSSKTQKLKNV